MNCKFCNAELEEGMDMCPQCGKELKEQEPQIQSVGENSSVETLDECFQDTCSEEQVISCEEVAEEALETVKPKKCLWKTLLIALCSILLLGILVVAILYGMGINLKPHSNDFQYKGSYTVEEADAVKVAKKVVAKANGCELTNAELQAHYFGTMYQFMDSYGAGYFSYGEPLDAQIFSEENGMTWQQYFLLASIENWHRYQILSALAEEDGFVADLSNLETLLEELETAAVGYGFENAEAMIQADMGTACTVEDYMQYLSLLHTGNQYADHLQSTMEPSVEDLEGYYAENEQAFIEAGLDKASGNVGSVRHILIVPEGEAADGVYSEKQLKDALAEAEKILKEWKAGEATQESFVALASEYSDDPGVTSNGGLYENITPFANYVEPFRNWAVDQARTEGETGIIESEFGYHIMYFVSGEPLWITAARENYIPWKLNTIIDENAERWPLKVTYRNIVVTDANVAE